MTKKTWMASAFAVAVAAVAFTAGPTMAADDKKEGGAKVDAAIESYKPVAGVSGNISSIGSDTLNNLMTLWSEGFRKHYPNVKFAVEGKGSTTAVPALIDGKADLGPMSRPMKSDEIKKFEDKFGYKPTAVAVGLDALAVFVHKDNPVEKLTLAQVDAIFSATRKGGYSEDITKWGQAGLKGEWENLGITLYGRNSASGTYGFFKENALFKGDFKATVKEQPGSSTVVQLVSEDRTAAGYSGIGYKTAGVRTVPLAKDASSEAFDATPENCYSGKYPLSRFLLIYVNKAPGKELPVSVREFFRYVLSKEGQEVTVKDGFIPLRKRDVDKYLEQLEG
ncbi:MAG: phosphate ABC transporter substrate-binding protein [Planctomycetes bacterium]|nr:phosphate ABC transporter substrate-binding protein [Planctomycetota bacterium]MCL4729887.1 phosphate ABC transporter substrate-binding protein [Planctomycetota bacterium]